ncbi:MAG: cytidylate kinase family protein [Betaproteobacteria bacterium]|nr:cytidylate kinase family protein [Betaproteobacteria bacterium]
MPLIAMTREMGSLGKDVAKGVGEALGIPVIHHEIIDSLANKMRVRKSHVIRLLEGKANIFERLTADKTSLSIFTAEETFQMALMGKGAIIRGWGATHLLRHVPHAICVRVCAPMPLRVERMKERLNTDDAGPIVAEIEMSDEAHGAIMRRHFGVDWHDAELYDVVLNTERVSVEECVEEVLNLVNHPDFKETDASHGMLEDFALQACIRSALRANPDTSGVRINIDVAGKHVTLSGLANGAQEMREIERVLSQVPGVAEVKNQLRVPSEARYKLDG